MFACRGLRAWPGQRRARAGLGLRSRQLAGLGLIAGLLTVGPSMRRNPGLAIANRIENGPNWADGGPTKKGPKMGFTLSPNWVMGLRPNKKR